jgi:large subunit ribosomal protein L13
MANSQTISKKWFIVDGTNMPLGRLASQVAAILKGKHKPEYTPHVDTGDFVIVINSDKIVLTGKKLEQKFYQYHSGYIGGLKSVGYDRMMSEKSDEAVRLAVKGMLPKNSLGRSQIKKLRVYKNDQHGHEAQKPTKITLKGVRE